mgnify:CR=1 FL=1
MCSSDLEHWSRVLAIAQQHGRDTDALELVVTASKSDGDPIERAHDYAAIGTDTLIVDLWRSTPGRTLDSLHSLSTILGKTGVEEADHRNVESIEPDDWPIRLGAMIVPCPTWSQNEIPGMHRRPLAVDRSVGARSLNDESKRTLSVTMRRSDLSGQDQLQAGVERLRDCCLPPERRILEDQNSPHRLLGVWDNGFRQITNNVKPIASVADLSSMKIRVPIGKLWISLFESLGAAPSGISFNEVYSALQTNVVDGQENPLAIIDTAKLNEVQKYCSITNHMWDGFWFLANRRAWERLPEDLRAIVAKHINAAGLKQRTDVAAMNATLQKSLTEKGMVFNNANADSFRNRLRQAGFFAEWKAKFGDEAWALLERYSGKLG